MKRRELLAHIGTAALGLALADFPRAWAAPAEAPKRRLLYFTKSSSFVHSVIKRKGDEPAHSERILTELGEKHGFTVTCSKDGSLFTPEYLAGFDAYVFYTTGNLLQAGVDGLPPMTAEGKAALLDAVRDGKGFIGIHAATDTFHTRGGRENLDSYLAMLGGEFTRHGPQQRARLTIADKRFPGLQDLGDSLELHEEWYAHRFFAPDLHVLMVQETEGMKGIDYQRGPFPATWARMHGQGRVFYTSLGHREDVWTNPAFQSILLGGIAWAVRNVDADITPNLEQVTPRHGELPPPQPPKPPATPTPPPAPPAQM